MYTWPCSIAGCPARSALQDGFFCESCHRGFYPPHNTAANHGCLGMTAIERDASRSEIIKKDRSDTIKRIRGRVLEEYPGSSCPRPERGQYPRGGMNTHIPVIMADGSEWLARARLVMLRRQPRELRRTMIESEYLTIKILNERGQFVPAVKRPPGERRYFLVRKANGIEGDEPIRVEHLSLTEKKALFRDFASHYISLSNIPFSGIGSLWPDDSDDVRVGPLIDYRYCSIEPPHYQGPFKTTRERYLCHIDDFLHHLQVAPNAPSSLRFTYLMHLEMRRLVENCEEMGREETEHYLVHADDNGSHFLLKDNRLQAVIDWEWAYTTTKAEAFAPAHAFIDHDRWLVADMSLSEAELLLIEAYEELGRPDLAMCARNGRKYQKLRDLLSDTMAGIQDVRGLQAAFGEAPWPNTNEERWCRAAEERFAEDKGWKRISARWASEI